MATSADPIDLAAPPVSDEDAVPLATRIASAEPAQPGTMQVDQVDNGVATLTGGPNGEQVIQVPAGQFQEGQTVPDPNAQRLPQDQLDAIAAQGAYAPPPGSAGPAATGEPPVGMANVLGAVVPVQGQPPVGAPAPGAPGAPAATGPATLPPGSADLEKKIDEANTAQAKATTDLGEAQQQAGRDVGQAYADQAELRRQQAADLAAEQQYVHDRQTALDKEDADVLRQAQQKTIPDFWAGREGSMVGAAITVALSGAAGALLGSTHNQAAESIQHNVDAYFGREKEKIDNLYKYAEQKGMLDEKTKARYAGELTDLMQQHAYALASVSDRIQQVTAESQGRVAKAEADKMAAGFSAQAASELQQARGLDIKRYDSESDRMKALADQTRAQADLIKANAIRAKHAGGGGGGGATDWQQAMHDAAQEPGATPASVQLAATNAGYRGKQNQLSTMAKSEISAVTTQTGKIETQMKGLETQLNGPGGKGGPASQLSRIQAMKTQIAQAAAAGDPDGIKAAVTAIKEEAGGMLSGGKTTRYTGHMLQEAQSLEDQLKSNWSKISGHPTEGAHFVSAMQKLLNTVEGEKLQEVHEIRQKGIDEMFAPGVGLANSKATHAYALGRFKDLTGAIKDANGNPVYMEGGATGQAPAAAPKADPNADARAWVAANPNDPRAAQIKQRLGL